MLMFHQFFQHHPTSREITIMSKKMNPNHLTLTGLLLVSLFLSVTTLAGDYSVRNDKELESVLKIVDPVKNILFIDNVIVEDPQMFAINPGDQVYIDLDQYNFQGNDAVYFRGDGAITINGSTTAFNGGLHLQGNLTLNYEGVYSMSGVDRFGDQVGDVVTVNLTQPGSVWNGAVLPGPFLANLVDAETRDGTLIIGDAGKATMNVINGNTVRNAETILGAQSTGEGLLNLSGGNANWYTSGSFYVGYEGKGTLNVSNGVNTQTGSIVVGKEAGANGTLNITGLGTVVNLYGRLDNDQLRSEGYGVMYLMHGAFLNFDDSATQFGERSGYVPKLGLGNGASIVDDSKIFGAIDGNTGRIIGIDRNGDLNDNSLTFRNNSVLEGSLKISMGINQFLTGSIVTPGLGSYRTHEGFGRFDFTNNNFFHDSSATTYIDFDVHGDKNCVPPVVYTDGYLGDRGRDLIAIDGNATLDGTIEFRPQSGYYSDNIAVDFMHITGTIADEKMYDNMRLIPSRWFRNPTLVKSDESVDLVMARNKTPFTNIANSYNLRGVGGALNGIYNAQTNAEWLNVLDWMWLMNDNELRGFMRQLSGETRASSALMPVRAPWRFAFDRTDVNEIGRYQREQQRCCDTFCSSSTKIVNNDLWAAPFYDYFHGSFDGNANSSTNSRIGIMVGYDRALSAKSSLGFLFAYSSPELNQWYSRVSADDYLMGLHFNTILRDKYELKLWGSYGTQAYRLHRDIFVNDRVERMTAGYTGNTVALSSQIAMPIKWRSFIVRPLAALDLSIIQQNGATERGYDAIALRYDDSCWTQLFGRLGVKADYTWRRWDCNASLAYSLMFLGDEAPTVKNQFLAGGSSFRVRGTDLGRHFLNIGLGGRRWLNDQKTQMLFVQYNGEYGENSNEQTVAVGYQRAF